MASRSFIPIYRPELGGKEREYVLRCLDANAISTGEFVAAFEAAFASLAGAKHAISTSSGTTALHLTMHSLGIGRGDEVLIPTFTFAATANAVAQTGATPVLIDCDPLDWLIDPNEVEQKITKHTRAIVAVHLYRGVCNLTALKKIASKNDLKLIEDCAQAIGSTFDDQHVGTIGDAGTFSFFGNKTITTGEGGMVITNDSDLFERMRHLRNHAVSPSRPYWHTELGFNYKMSNLSAAIGLAQIDRISEILVNKRQIFNIYESKIDRKIFYFQKISDNIRSGEWLFSIILPKDTNRSSVIEFMKQKQIDIRPTFHCLHEMPAYRNASSYPHAEDISRRGISLPSYPGLSVEEIDWIVSNLEQAVSSKI
jgi:perosamine synthetase